MTMQSILLYTIHNTQYTSGTEKYRSYSNSNPRSTRTRTYEPSEGQIRDQFNDSPCILYHLLNSVPIYRL